MTDHFDTIPRLMSVDRAAMVAVALLFRTETEV